MTAPSPIAPPPEFPTSYRAPYNPRSAPEVIEEVKGSSGDVREELRNRCKYDRYFLAKGILGYQDVNPYTHGPLLSALQDKSRQRRMYLMHRGSLKSTLGTITDFVGEGLADPNEFRGLIVNEIEENAVGFISEIKAHFETNELLHELFPELIPKRFGGPGSKWSTTKACLPRTTAYKEWTWRGVGVGSAIVSQHFSHIKCDDLIGFGAHQSAATMKYATDYAKALEPLLISMDENIIDYVGTRWAIHDLYREIIRIYGVDLAYFAREDIEIVPTDMPDDILLEAGFKPEQLDPASPKYVKGTPQPIFPRKFSMRRLQRLREMDPVLYYAQFKNNPIADGIKDFNATKIRWFDFDRQGNVVYRDPVTQQLMRWPRETLDVVMACDPNSGDLTAPDFPSIVVAAYSPLEQVFVFESWAKRVQPDTYVETIFELWQKWHPRIMGIEKAGMDKTIFYFKKMARDLKVDINPEPLLHKNREKRERIRKALGPIINKDRLFMRKGFSRSLEHQITFHPDLDNDDEVDALAYTTELFIKPLSQKERGAEKRAADMILAQRNSISGY